MSGRSVSRERTGWRDQALSERHRMWGWDVPCLDIDFLLVEYDRGNPKALIDYKHIAAATTDMMGRSYEAIRALCRAASLPFFEVRYETDNWTFSVLPMNGAAHDWMAPEAGADEEFGLSLFQGMSEREYVRFLYQLRDRFLPPQVLAQLEGTN